MHYMIIILPTNIYGAFLRERGSWGGEDRDGGGKERGKEGIQWERKHIDKRNTVR